MRRILQHLLGLLRWLVGSVPLWAALAYSQELSPYSFDIGEVSVTDYYIDPSNGSDSASGLSLNSPLRTVQHAWNLIPNNAELTTGYRLNLLNGTYTEEHLPEQHG